MTVYQSLSLLKVLCHNHQGIIDGTVAMWMIFTHGITYDTGAFSIRPVIADTQFIHIIQGSSLYRFQSVTNIRQCS